MKTVIYYAIYAMIIIAGGYAYYLFTSIWIIILYSIASSCFLTELKQTLKV